MTEGKSYEAVMSRLLERVREAEPNLDTRVGSVIYTALAPAAVEMVNLYIEADSILAESFADTAGRDFLVRRAAERGLSPLPATAAMRKGEFDAEVPIGSRFSCETLCYRVTERMEGLSCRLICETPGEAGNALSGKLVPIEYIPGLGRAELTELLIPGEDEEETEAFRKRYFAGLNAQAFGGNAADYREKAGALPGVGGCKVFPAWKGGGTVKVVLLSSVFGQPSQALIDAVQAALDPPESSGEGMGLAPIGHRVTVAPVEGRAVDISTQLTFQAGWDWPMVRSAVEGVIDGYFLELARKWEASETCVVRVSQIESRLLDLEGILDVQHTALNGEEKNLSMNSTQIPVRGAFNG